MVQSNHEDLLIEINSSDFECSQCINYLREYFDVIGIQHILVQKLNTYTYEELEFFIPQFVQLLIAFETDSMALEDFLLDYCTKYPHFSLIVFWNLQSNIFELRDDPESYAFQTARKFNNKLQNILFNSDLPRSTTYEFRENLQPAIIMIGMIAASIGLPQINTYASPIIESQANQQKSLVFKLANFQKSLTKNLTLKNKRLSRERSFTTSDDENAHNRTECDYHPRSSSVPRTSLNKNSLTLLSDESEYYLTDEDIEGKLSSSKVLLNSESEITINDKMTNVEKNLRINTIIKSKRGNRFATNQGKESVLNGSELYNINSKSLPDLSRVDADNRPWLYPTESETSLNIPRTSMEHYLDGKKNRSIIPKFVSNDDLSHKLQVNYSKKVTSFVMALQNVSLRLSQVPKEARLSALRAELSIINKTLLPSEIDIPQLLPITSNKNKKYHKILRLNVNEACVLNLAERVPFLLSIEYLSDELDFNPLTESNQKLLASDTFNESKIRDASSTSINFNVTGTARLSTTDTEDQTEVLSNSMLPLEADLSDLTMLPKKNTKEVSGVVTKEIQTRAIKEKVKLGTDWSITGSEASTTDLANQMRIAAVMLQQLESSGQTTSEQSIAIKNRIVESMIALQDQFDSINYAEFNQLPVNSDAGQRKLENDFKLGEDWSAKKQRIRKSSAYGHLENWDLCSVIVKNGDDLPQEAFACQLIRMISLIWKKNGVEHWTKNMKILITSADTGLVETITNAISIHSIKKSLTEISMKTGENSKGRIFTLKDYYVKMFGKPEGKRFKRAQNNFAKSLASYSIICYVLQIKDRHNGNIMVDNEGHIIHIDFGFLLSNSPGSVGFEAAPFKFTAEYVDLLGGVDSAQFARFKELCKSCFNALRKDSDQLVNIVRLMQKDSSLPCFNNRDNTSVLLHQRLQTHLTNDESDVFVENSLIAKSLGSMYTRLYDQFQMVTQGIYS